MELSNLDGNLSLDTVLITFFVRVAESHFVCLCEDFVYVGSVELEAIIRHIQAE